ncbi:hypothetical protein FRAAL1767 [Frankia alni ACN14a]|uniref:Uncharacterized protein n=1 Tax=Frankia alni (strain DSM 45986 / CECT 9034 / ACN14a) TaxID=326424 RepID=Q0RPW0_FRAAA|nr:hypothetical protein FRAAL1767 [Frankia alni ACN14a]
MRAFRHRTSDPVIRMLIQHTETIARTSHSGNATMQIVRIAQRRSGPDHTTGLDHATGQDRERPAPRATRTATDLSRGAA